MALSLLHNITISIGKHALVNNFNLRLNNTKYYT